MTDREPRTVRIDPDVWDEFVEFVVETEGQKRGYTGQHVENALSEYVDRDRYARIEEQVEENADLLAEIRGLVSDESGEHTHKGPTTVRERAERIAADLQSADSHIITTGDVEQAIREHAGSSDRTFDKYKRELKQLGELYENPHHDSEAWTVDRMLWVRWATDYVDNVPDAHYLDLIDDYPMDSNDWDRITTKVTQ